MSSLVIWGQGNILYNIFLGTELNRMNEFVIYDTPDVNIGFDGNMKVYIPTNYGNLDNVVLQNGNYYAEPGNMDDEGKMEIYIYDLVLSDRRGKCCFDAKTGRVYRRICDIFAQGHYNRRRFDQKYGGCNST